MRFKDVVNVKAEGYDYENAPKRPLILKMGQKITDRKFRKINYNDPEYYGLAAVTTDLEAKIALTMEVREEYTIEQMMKKTKKLKLSQKELEDTLFHMGYIGTIEWHYRNNPDGSRTRLYVLPRFVMGSAEFTNMHRSTIEKNPEVARFFERMCFDPLNGLTPMIPPGGAGIGMHVIPVEKAIEKVNSTIDIEHISYWLDKYEGHIAASPCACTMCQEVLGQGGGRDAGDWCIAVGDMADYTVETDKGHYVSKERALEICLQAEKNGYVHQITNNDGKNKIIAICNCDPKVCHALRTSQLFNTPNLSRSSFIAHVDKSKCVACGRCVEYCPAGAVRLGQKLCKADGSEVTYPRIEDPFNTKWDRSKWSENYNDTNRINCYPTGTAPCKSSCPAHIAVQGYLKLAGLGMYKEALELIKKNNPLPAICGRICNKKCEEACTRGNIDNPVSIDAVKKFVADLDLNEKTRFIPEKEVPSAVGDFPQKIAIVGSGPAGLSCAYYLALKGYHPTIFEKNEQPGGMLRYGIPTYKLEKDVIDAEIEIIKLLGVEIKCGVEVGKDITIDELRKQGYEGFYLAIGCQGGKRPGVANDEAEGTDIAVNFLKGVYEHQDQKLEGEVVVVGGGNVAVDCARSAKRLGASKVSMVCLESRETMPASLEEIAETLDEDIEIVNCWGPKEVKVDGKGHVSSIVFKKCLRTIDPETKKFSPVYDENETMELSADKIVFAIGQAIVWGDLLKGSKVETARNGAPAADPLTYQTAEKDIFVGGDVYTGPKFAIDAIAAGKEAAISLARAVHPGCTLDEGRNRNDYIVLNKDDIKIDSYDHTPRQEAGLDSRFDPRRSFKDAHLNLTPEQVKKETARCLSCGASIVDPNKCIGCGICTTKCMFYAITLSRDIPEASDMVPCEDTMKKVFPYLIKRTFAIKKRKRQLKKEAKAKAKASASK
ncbi:MAG: FAD-dependent oxidoreductase [Bacillota bacterium]|nr:FAD-dependent oxidoreductase [Bacillota bacterium]